jgi:hypothetical protein
MQNSSRTGSAPELVDGLNDLHRSAGRKILAAIESMSHIHRHPKQSIWMALPFVLIGRHRHYPWARRRRVAAESEVMVYKDHGHGSLKIDRVFRGVEIRKATGCPDTPAGWRRAAAIEAMCEALADPRTGRLDLLRDVARGAVKLGALYDQFKAGKLHLIPPRVTRSRS